MSLFQADFIRRMPGVRCEISKQTTLSGTRATYQDQVRVGGFLECVLDFQSIEEVYQFSCGLLQISIADAITHRSFDPQWDIDIRKTLSRCHAAQREIRQVRAGPREDWPGTSPSERTWPRFCLYDEIVPAWILDLADAPERCQTVLPNRPGHSCRHEYSLTTPHTAPVRRFSRGAPLNPGCTWPALIFKRHSSVPVGPS